MYIRIMSVISITCLFSYNYWHLLYSAYTIVNLRTHVVDPSCILHSRHKHCCSKCTIHMHLFVTAWFMLRHCWRWCAMQLTRYTCSLYEYTSVLLVNACMSESCILDVHIKHSRYNRSKQVRKHQRKQYHKTHASLSSIATSIIGSHRCILKIMCT
jgi:hypothetical protein